MPSIPDVTPPDYTTTTGQVRLLIPDVEQIVDPATPLAAAEYIFNDSQIQAFLVINKDNIKRAAADAKMALATSEALIGKVIRTDDLQTDGAKLGAELRAQAKELRDQAEKDIAYDSSDSFEVVEYNNQKVLATFRGITYYGPEEVSYDLDGTTYHGYRDGY